MNQKHYKLADLVHGLDVTIKGDPDCLINGICTIDASWPDKITFLANSLYHKKLATTQAAAVILTEKDAVSCPVTAVISRNPYLTYAKVAAFFATSISPINGIHSTAVIGKDCQIDPSASIGANCVVGDQVNIAANVVIGPGSMIGNNTEIGEASRLDARVAVYHQVKIGKRARIASGVVIGSDGFGFANKDGIWHKVPQLGGVDIGDDVEIGANTTIDRGAVGNTIIEDGVKLDNLIQVAHNVRIGTNTIIAACVGISGSTIIGKNCMVGGATCFAGHVEVCDNVILTGMSSVTKSINVPGMYSSGIVGAIPNQAFLKNNARFNRLESLIQRIKKLEIRGKTSLKETAE